MVFSHLHDDKHVYERDILLLVRILSEFHSANHGRHAEHAHVQRGGIQRDV